MVVKHQRYIDGLDVLAGKLPFHIDDVDRVNELYVRWREDEAEEDRRELLLWLYVWAQRYVLKRLAREAHVTPNDFDRISSAVFDQAQRGWAEVKNPARFNRWVNVVCRNAFVAERKKEKPRGEIDFDLLESGDATDGLADDGQKILRILRRRVESLPPAVREVVRLRLLEKAPYADIVERTGLRLQTVRTYFGRGRRILMADPEIVALARDILPSSRVLDGKARPPDGG